LVGTNHPLYTPNSKAFNMVEENGITASQMYAERIMKVQIPLDDNIDWLKELEKFNKKYGRKLDPEEVNRLLHERFGE
jgi:hypothetical protein